jgi:hypothetical protein
MSWWAFNLDRFFGNGKWNCRFKPHLKESDHLGDVGIDERITLKGSFMNWV